MTDLLYTAHVPAGENLPAVIALHGWGASAHDLLQFAPLLFDGEAIVLCPQGRVRMNVGPGMAGYGWFPFAHGTAPDPAAVLAAADGLRAFLDEVTARFPVDLQRLVVLGFSQGGAMAYELALRDPLRFAGLVALSTWLPAELTEHLPPRPEHEGLPVLVLHGTADPSLPVDRARESRERLRPYGVTMTYRELQMGHTIDQEAMRILQRWLKEKAVRREATAKAAQPGER